MSAHFGLQVIHLDLYQAALTLGNHCTEAEYLKMDSSEEKRPFVAKSY